MILWMCPEGEQHRSCSPLGHTHHKLIVARPSHDLLLVSRPSTSMPCPTDTTWAMCLWAPQVGFS